MSRTDEELHPEDLRTRDLLRGLSRPVAEPIFRDRLRREFAEGTIRGALPSGGSIFDRIRDWADAIRRPVVWIPAATSIAAALFLLWNASPPRPEWTLRGSMGEGSLRVDGTVVSIATLGSEPDLLRPGRRIVIEGDLTIDLMLGRSLLLQAAPGSEFEIPHPPRRRLSHSTEGAVERGEVRFVTGAEFAGSTLIVHGPSADAIVQGTTLAVLCGPDSTCVCVFDGVVRMVDPGGAGRDVPAGTRRTRFASTARAPLEEPIRPMESMKLAMLQDAVQEIWKAR